MKKTETGRILYRKPVTQDIPIRTEFGRQLQEAVAAHAREKEPIFDLDYAELELRIAYNEDRLAYGVVRRRKKK